MILKLKCLCLRFCNLIFFSWLFSSIAIIFLSIAYPSFYEITTFSLFIMFSFLVLYTINLKETHKDKRSIVQARIRSRNILKESHAIK